MKFLVQILCIVVIGWLLEMFLPWWGVAIAAFIGGYIMHTRASFAAGFLAIALLWFLKAWLIHSSASTDLVKRIAELLMVKQPFFLMLVTAIVGGLVGGFASMSGSLLRKRKRRYGY